MFKIMFAKDAKKQAEQSIKESEQAAADYHEALARNDNAHEELMRKLDRRSGPRRA